MFHLSVLAWAWESLYSALDLQLLIAGQNANINIDLFIQLT